MNIGFLEKLQNELRLKQLEADALLEIVHALNSNRSREDLLKIVGFIFRGQLGVQKLSFFVREEAEWKNIIHFGISSPSGEMEENIRKTGGSDSAVEEYLKAWIRNFSGEYQMNLLEVRVNKEIRAYLLFQIWHTDIERIEGYRIFIQTIANIVIVALENHKLIDMRIRSEALRRELQVASDIQKNLFPRTLPATDAIHVSALNIPHSEVGGDFYTVLQLNPHAYAFVVADVSGKGIPASLLMSNLQAVLQISVTDREDLKTVIRNINRILYENYSQEKFVTLFLARYDTQGRKMEYVNAGHPPPFYSCNGSCRELDKGTTLLGIFPDIKVQTGELHTEPGSSLFMFTDGLNEAENQEGEMFGTEQARQYFVQSCDGKESDFIARLLSELSSFCGNRAYSDDITLLHVSFY